MNQIALSISKCNV